MYPVVHMLLHGLVYMLIYPPFGPPIDAGHLPLEIGSRFLYRASI